MAQKTHLPGGSGEQPIGAAKRDVKAIAATAQGIIDDLMVSWTALNDEEKLDVLHQQALFSMRVNRYLLLKEFGE